jgi:hypothetical protein
VYHKPHIGLVDPHAKGHSCNHDLQGSMAAWVCCEWGVEQVQLKALGVDSHLQAEDVLLLHDLQHFR